MFATRTVLFSCVCLLLTKKYALSFIVNHAEKKRLVQSSSTRLQMRVLRQRQDALTSMTSTHEGLWEGKSTSFTVNSNVGDGIQNKKESLPYQVHVELDLKESNIVETIKWKSEEADIPRVARRISSLEESSVDVDDVDGSYSLDFSISSNDLPSVITGTNALVKFGTEHCLVQSDDERVRMFALYGIDDQLLRVVLCTENRVKEAGENVVTGSSGGVESSESSIDILKAPQQEQTPTGFDRIEQLKEVMEKDAIPLRRRTMNLKDLCDGLWLGDMIVRDWTLIREEDDEGGPVSKIVDETFAQLGELAVLNSKFAVWARGTQKCAMHFQWELLRNLVRCSLTHGKSLGYPVRTDIIPQADDAFVAVNEGIFRRIKPEDQMVYLSFAGGEYAGFLMDSNYIKVPRYISPSGKGVKPFFTELCVFSQTDPDQPTSDGKKARPEICCGKIMRIYNDQARLLQSSTGFFTFKSMEEVKAMAEEKRMGVFQ